MAEQTPKSDRPTNPYARDWQHFLEETADHVLTVLKEEGLYRHLRIGAPRTSAYSWQIITWPYHLVSVGDVADGFVFARDTDMLKFFTLREYSQGYYSDGAPSIDFRYWAEKLGSDQRGSAKRYSPKKFMAAVQELLDEDDRMSPEALSEEDLELCDDAERREIAQSGAKAAATKEEVLNSALENSHSADMASRWISENDGIHDLDLYGLLDDDFDDWTHSFLIACWAIELTTRLWDQRAATIELAATRQSTP